MRAGTYLVYVLDRHRPRVGPCAILTDSERNVYCVDGMRQLPVKDVSVPYVCPRYTGPG